MYYRYIIIIIASPPIVQSEVSTSSGRKQQPLGSCKYMPCYINYYCYYYYSNIIIAKLTPIDKPTSVQSSSSGRKQPPLVSCKYILTITVIIIIHT